MIVVLLILAGVTIATLTGDNGLLQKATDAKQANEEATALEKIKVEVAGSYGVDGKIDIENQLNQNLKRINGLTYNNNEIVLNDATKKITKLPATVKLNGYAFKISENGDVSKISEWIKKENGQYINEETKQTLTVGDIVKYETILNNTTVDSEKLTQLKTNLKKYSGDSSSTDNANIDRDSLTWKFLDIKDGKIRLISASPTNKLIKFYGANGYNNAVYLIDEACKTLYESDKGTAQNLKIEDIEEKIDRTKFDYTQYVYPSSNTLYGGTKEYTGNSNYPNIYKSEVGCKAVSATDNTNNTLRLSQQSSLVDGNSTSTNMLKVTQTHWEKTMEKSDFFDFNYYTLFVNNGSNYPIYWLASRCVIADSACAFLDCVL